MTKSAPELIVDDASLRYAVRQLRMADPECIARMIETAGPPPLRKREASLDGLIRIIIAQQVSTASASAIYRRFGERFPACAHDALLAAPDSDLQACGLSTPKIRTIRHLCAAIEAGFLDMDALAHADLQDARNALTAIKGIGPWTADVYFLFCLGHPDVWPVGDLALQEGVRMALNLRKRPDSARMEKISRRWQPWRAVAARLIWAYYGAERARLAQQRGMDKAGPAVKSVATTRRSKATTRGKARKPEST